MASLSVRLRNMLQSVHLGYFKNFFGFAYGKYPALRYATVLYIVSVMLEVLAMNAFIPLSEIAAGKPISPNSAIIKILGWWHFNATSPKIIFLSFIVAFSLRVLTQIWAEYMLGKICHYIMLANLVVSGLENVVRHTSIADIERKSSGYFMSLVGEEVNRATAIVITAVRCVTMALMAGLYYVMITSYSFATGIGILLVLGVMSLNSYSILRRIHRFGVQATETARTTDSIFVDAFNGVRSIRSFRAEEYVVERFRAEMFRLKYLRFIIDFLTFLGKMLPMLLLVAVFGLFILIGTQLTGAAFDYAFSVTLLLFLLRFFMALGDAVNIFLKIVSDARAAKDISEVISTHATATAAEKHTQAFAEDIHTIAVQDLVFSHNKQDLVLQGFNVVFERGKSYAIVGESGAGKSTLLDILLKFLTPDGGQITVNYTPLAEIDEQSLRKNIILLGQDTIIFNDTIQNNITYGQPANEADVRDAADIACVREVIEALPDGYNTMLQYRGTNLSGGQRQRIGIARAVFRKPDVLIFDESMSALDPATKEQVLENILNIYKEKIVIFVSHDLSIRSKVDVVVEMHKYRASETNPVIAEVAAR